MYDLCLVVLYRLESWCIDFGVFRRGFVSCLGPFVIESATEIIYLNRECKISKIGNNSPCPICLNLDSFWSSAVSSLVFYLELDIWCNTLNR
jgi:hypothetical protein